MSKLYYYYGAMNSSKTANLLMAAHNYNEQGKKILCFKPIEDNRWGNTDKIISRLGISIDCIALEKSMDIFNLVSTYLEDMKTIDCIFIDEAQFLNKNQVMQFVEVIDRLKIPVMCYGLKNTYQKGKLFEGSETILFYADKISEIKTMCHFCNKKATMNLRTVNNKPIYEGDVIVVGDTDNNIENSYIQTCRYHYNNPPK